MFKRLRRRFTTMNMLVISLLMLAAFTTVYIFTYTNVQQKTNTELQRLLEAPGGPGDVLPQPERANGAAPPEGDAFAATGDGANAQGGALQGMQEVLPTGLPRIGFSVRYTDGGYALEQGGFLVNTENFDIPAMLQAAAGQSKATGSFRLDGYTWAYESAQMPDGSTKIAFVETSEGRALLLTLIEVFAVVTVVLLVAIWLVSRWFARQSIAPIEKAYDDQLRFVQDASHELKTPVAVMKTNLELLSSHQTETVADQGEWLDNMRTETVHMEKLTGLLLALARTETDAPKSVPENFSLSDAVEACILPLEAVFYEKDLRFHSQVEENIRMNGSQDEVERLVHILVENAIQYTPAGGEITLQLNRAKHKAMLQVTNTGSGIPPEDLPHIFKRFYRADKSRNSKSGGYGLGLSIAENIVRRAGGEISAESEPGGITRFSAMLPAAP